MSNPRKQLIFGLTLSSLLALVAASPIDIEQNSTTCVYTNIAPEIDLLFGTRVISSDQTVLADASAYIREVGVLSNEVFLPLHFESVKARGGRGRSEVVFNADCAEATFRVGLAEDGQKVVDEIKLTFVAHDGSRKTCSTKGLRLSYDEDKHLACNEQMKFNCQVASSDSTYMMIAELNMDFEFEFGRDPTKTQPGVYSTPAQECKRQA